MPSLKRAFCASIQLVALEVELGTKLLLACGVLLLAPCSIALDCRDTPLEQYFERADIVYMGTLKSTNDALETLRTSSSWKVGENGNAKEAALLEVQFKVEHVWKGELTNEVQVYTPHPNDDVLATYPFEVESRYVVFADFREAEEDSEQAKKYLITSWCSGNVSLGNSKYDIDLKDLSNNTLHRQFGELETESELVERFGDLRSKLEDSDNSEEAEEDTIR